MKEFMACSFNSIGEVGSLLLNRNFSHWPGTFPIGQKLACQKLTLKKEHHYTSNFNPTVDFSSPPLCDISPGVCCVLAYSLHLEKNVLNDSGY